MKALFFCLTAFLFVFYLGCRENSISAPETANAGISNAQSPQNAQNFSSKDLISYYPRKIEVNSSIYDPTHPQNVSDQIKGIIRFDHKLVPLYSTPNQNQYTVQLRLYVNLLLDANCSKHSECMRVVGTAEQIVNFSGLSTRYREFEKVFAVRDACCGQLNLVLTFKVDKTDLYLVSMTLKKVSGWMPIPNPES